MADYIFDIDGTIADVTHRRHYVACKPKNWPAFEKKMHMDTPIEPIVELIRHLYDDNRIILCSGRG